MSFFSKTYRVSQVSMMGLSLESYSRRLPKWGSMRNGDVYPQQTQARRTDGNDGSVCPTPVNSDDKNRQPGTPHLTSNGNIRHKSETGETYFMRLSQVVKLWSTPQAADAGQGSIIGKDDTYYLTNSGVLRKKNGKGTDGSIGLGRSVKLWGTPTAVVTKRSGQEGSKGHSHDISRGNLKGQIIEGTATAINPAWELLLMGFPADWLDTDGPPDRGVSSMSSSRRVYSQRRHRTGRTKCGLSETPSSRSASTRLPCQSASFYRASMRARKG